MPSYLYSVAHQHQIVSKCAEIHSDILALWRDEVANLIFLRSEKGYM